MYADVVDGYAQVTLTDCRGTGMYICATAYSVDADGNVTELAAAGGDYYSRDYVSAQ